MSDARRGQETLRELGYVELLSQRQVPAGVEFARHLDAIYNEQRDLRQRLKATEEHMAHYEKQANRSARLVEMYEKLLRAVLPTTFDQVLRPGFLQAAESTKCLSSTPV